MTLKAVLFDFNGVIINDEPIHERLIGELLLSQNLRSDPEEFARYCLGRTDRACLTDVFAQRGRVLRDAEMETLLASKAEAYSRELAGLKKLPLYPGLDDLLFRCRIEKLKLAVVTGARRSEVEQVLSQANLRAYFSVVVSGDDVSRSKPAPDGYLLAMEQLRQQYPDLALEPQDCLAIEDTFDGIEAAKRAGMSVVGIANTYPFHMIQRQANWAIDYLNDLELNRVQRVLAGQDEAEPPESGITGVAGT